MEIHQSIGTTSTCMMLMERLLAHHCLRRLPMVPLQTWTVPSRMFSKSRLVALIVMLYTWLIMARAGEATINPTNVILVRIIVGIGTVHAALRADSVRGSDLMLVLDGGMGRRLSPEL